MAPDGAQARAREAQIRRILAEHAERTVPRGGREAIRARAAAPHRPWWRRLFSRSSMPRPYLMPALEAALRDRVARHTCDPRPDPLFPDDVRCRICGQRPCKNGAPEAPGTPPNPTAVKEPTMSHDLIEEGTPRGRQMAAALALFHLLESGPDETAEWRIDDLGRLHGHVRRPHSDADARRAVHEFAGFLGSKGAERSQGRNDHAEWIHLSASGTYRGVPVNVWTHVAIRPVSPYSSFKDEQDGGEGSKAPTAGTAVPGRPGRLIGDCGHPVWEVEWYGGRRTCQPCEDTFAAEMGGGAS